MGCWLWHTVRVLCVIGGLSGHLGYGEQALGMTEPSPPVSPIPPLAVQVKIPFPFQGRSPISDLIYGTSAWFVRADDTALPFPLRRFGGNSSSRYNYRINATNAGSDWYFMNIPLPYVSIPPDALWARAIHPLPGELSLSDYWALHQSAQKRDFLLTIPMMGWVAKDRADHWGYPVHRYGKQQLVEYQTSHGDAGNGIDVMGNPILTGDPKLTSMEVGPQFVVEWLRHLKKLLGKDAGHGGIRYVALDNEPALWHKTHQDLRYGDPKVSPPGPVGFDEIWERTMLYGAQIKKEDPKIQILGPSSWGWCDYFGYGKDHCEWGMDRLQHGGKPFLQWYLKNICDYKKSHGIQLVDYLDIHYYPAAIEAHAAENPAEQKKRLQATRTFYDPTFIDGSWIRDPIQLIPRVKAWIRESCPDVKLAITEWRFAVATDSISSALAQVETLLIFGREGVELASLWNDLHKGSLADLSFKMFLDYDNKGASALQGHTLSVETSEPLDFPAYAIASDGRLLLYLFNKTSDTRKLTVKTPGTYQVRRAFILDEKGLNQQPIPIGETLSQPGMSVTLLEMRS